MKEIVFALLVIVVSWFLLKNKKSKHHKKKVVHGKYHCVTVIFNESSCAAVKKLKGKRILSSEAPLFPLQGCDVDKCECRFQHHEERRDEERRGAYNKAIDDIAQSTMTITPRSSKDRRK